MKSYTFKLPRDKKNAKTYKEMLMERIITAYPWMTVDSKIDYPFSDYGVEYANAGDYITIGVSNRHNVSWLPKEFDTHSSKCCENCPFKCFDDNTINFDLETEFPKALCALASYAKEHYPFEKDYDFEDIFGTPIKIFDNFVQIGYTVIPIAKNSLNYLKPKDKKLVIDITIKVKKHGLF